MKFSIRDYKQSAFKCLIVTIFASFSLPIFAVKKETYYASIQPANWWINMKMNNIELLIQGENIAKATFELYSSDKKTDSKNTRITSIEPAKNNDFVYVTIGISGNQQPETLYFKITPENSKKAIFTPFPILENNPYAPLGLDQSDNMYLLFPDRFSNGDPSNDNNPSMNEPNADRSGLKLRHGGDIKGIDNHIDYIKNLGITALWINPLLENDQKKESYHGYAATDSYLIDRRFGTNEDFKNLTKKCHDNGIKMVWDVVYNHWGLEHKLFKALPDSNWFHWSKEFVRTNYRAETLMDPYASDIDRNTMLNGWFDNHMPDLNQQDPHLAKYLIQNSIWWIEFAGIDAFRIDTYSYPDQKFMSDLNAAIKKEYPNFLLFGETWVQGSPIQAWYTENNGLNKSFNSNLDGVTDFQLYFAITKGLNENFGWEEGLRRIELTLSHDFLYEKPSRNVTFLDNHDLSRFYSVINEDFEKWKIANAMLFTLRGIPCIYYGHEFLMKNYANPDALVREDFPGGWAGDTINKFESKNLKGKELEAFLFVQRLMEWRNENKWLKDAKLKQFVPEDNTYIYFRYDEKNSVMVIHNLNDESKEIKLSRFAESLGNYSLGVDIISGKATVLNEMLEIAPKSSLVLQLTQ